MYFNLLRSLYQLKGINFKEYILGRYIFLQNSFLQSKIPQGSSDGDYLQK